VAAALVVSVSGIGLSWVACSFRKIGSAGSVRFPALIFAEAYRGDYDPLGLRFQARYCTAFFSLRGGFFACGISRRVGVRLPGSFVSLEGFWCFKGSWRDETDEE
jgi:hypothetical protein